MLLFFRKNAVKNESVVKMWAHTNVCYKNLKHLDKTDEGVSYSEIS